MPQRSGQAFHIAAAASTQAPQVFDPGYDDLDEVEAAIRATSDGSHVSTDELQWRSVADLESTSGPQASTALQNGAPLPSEAEVAIKQELGDCTEWQDVLQIVEEEKAVMTPACCADALARYVMAASLQCKHQGRHACRQGMLLLLSDSLLCKHFRVTVVFVSEAKTADTAFLSLVLGCRICSVCIHPSACRHLAA